MKAFWVGIACMAGFGVYAQNLTDDDLAQRILEDLKKANEVAVPTNVLGRMVSREFVQLRFLDRLNGQVETLEIEANSHLQVKHLTVGVRSCFVPADNGASDAIAFLDIQDDRETQAGFNGWMIASSPALNALEHPRYDVWVVSCSNSATEQGNAIPDVPAPRPDELVGAETTA